MVYTHYGPPDVLHLAEVATPAPKDNEVLVRIHATSVNYGDLVARKFSKIASQEFNMPLPFWFMARIMLGVNKPKNSILGSEFAGEIASLGKDITHFKLGDQVFGYRGQRLGTYAEYVCMPEDDEITHKPATMTYAEAAVVPYGAITALNLLRKGNIQPGHKVLINGASGSIGLAAVQFARYSGAEVTGVCSTPRMELVKSLGAARVIDYTREDFTQNGERYDLIFDVLGRSSFARCRKVLKPEGRYLLASFKMKQLLQMLWTSRLSDQKVICALAPEKTGDLPAIKELVEAGNFQAAIDACFPLEQAAEAHRYAEAGQKKGHIAITVEQHGQV
jgi:NADPH:quinone reductase-like Zn-dependent oxidoreductase